MIIDLHDTKLEDAIPFFITKYNEFYLNGFKGEIEVIHGYGSSGIGGVIKKRFKSFSEAYNTYFNARYTNNLGVTFITPKKLIPKENFLLENEILIFCSNSPKSMNKIKNNFLKKYKQEDIKKSVLSLLKKNLLSEIQKKEICYLQRGEL
jgi:hypothetical protein